ncbi:MAG: hypothetical protein JWN93_2036 [Hyphomicrobiales bacterium]|nr:hypothetical protein [Hyphomicrobiales bacterium]
MKGPTKESHPCFDSRRHAPWAVLAWASWCLLGSWTGALAADRPFGALGDLHRPYSYKQGGASLTKLRISVNKSQSVKLGYAFSDVLVGSTKVLDVIPLDERSLYVLGKEIGATNISVLDADKRLVAVIDVEVGLDVGSVAEKVAATAGASGIRVRSQGDKIILSGSAADAPTVDRAMQVAAALAPGGVINTTRILSPQQVMLKVRVVEVNRSAGRDLGLTWQKFGKGGSTIDGSRLGRGGVDYVSRDKDTGELTYRERPGIEALVPFARVLAGFGPSFKGLDLFIDALESKGLVRKLAEPNLISLSGERAEFLAGGEYPVTTPASGTSPATTTYKKFGVSLEFTPTVLSTGVINIRVTPEVSDVASTAGTGNPVFSTRRATTTVELRDGQSFALAGLLENSTERNIDQLPWIGSIPVLGALFRSTGFRSRETELVVIVTPHLVRPARPGDRIDTPLDGTQPANDADLFLAGKLEVEKPVQAGAPALPLEAVAPGPAFGHVLQAAPGPARNAKARAY